MKDVLTKTWVLFFLSIAIPLMSLAVSYGAVTARLDQAEKEIGLIRAEHTAQRDVNEEIQVKLAEIQKDILYIREKLDGRAAK